ncbi:MAG: diacylglycerol kinase family protein [bacterium]|nr:diacylglycerol kinase family protein [bacterium]
MKNKNLLHSFKHAFAGIYSCLKAEKNIKIHYSVMVLVIIAGFIYKISTYEWLLCILCFGMVIATEMVNTAIEFNTDLAMPNINPKAKLAKDIAAGAVLITVITSVIIGLTIFIPKIFTI